jgi:(2Fe-2S) ferredoxin
MPHRERYLFVCTNRREPNNPKGSCAQKGSEELLKKLKAALLSRGVQGRFRACGAGCLDLCEEGISLVDEPMHVTYAHVTEADVEELADAMVNGTVVERLVHHDGRKTAAGAASPGGQA